MVFVVNVWWVMMAVRLAALVALEGVRQHRESQKGKELDIQWLGEPMASRTADGEYHGAWIDDGV